MPGRDRTGPLGTGPIGRGLGPCGGGMAGRGRGRGFPFGRGFGWVEVNHLDFLTDQKTILENQLAAINQRLSEVEKQNQENQNKKDNAE